jgi:hypothetical protein
LSASAALTPITTQRLLPATDRELDPEREVLDRGVERVAVGRVAGAEDDPVTEVGAVQVGERVPVLVDDPGGGAPVVPGGDHHRGVGVGGDLEVVGEPARLLEGGVGGVPEPQRHGGTGVRGQVDPVVTPLAPVVPVSPFWRPPKLIRLPLGSSLVETTLLASSRTSSWVQVDPPSVETSMKPQSHSSSMV